ncbi:MAG TPA: S53 family peptidase [Candidatus Dormibacteraeota bacterium]|nr:S53 family peptidase [Candidatus Dormibacteraeota bacterium]
MVAVLGSSVLALPGPTSVVAAGVVMHPTVSDYVQVSTSTTPPKESDCFSVGRRCFTPQAIQSAYDVAPLYAAGLDGRGETIAIVDSYGSDTIAHDLHVFDQAFGIAPMCGEEGVTCTTGMPTFSQLHLQGSPATSAPPSSSNGPGLENKAGWALEVSLDVETAHAMAPGANILLVTTPTAETLGLQGFPDMMNAEQFVVDHHLANVISQSFASAEEAFGSVQSLLNLRHAFISAAANGVTVLGSSGDGGTANGTLQSLLGPGANGVGPNQLIPFPSVEWPASDPLVTGVGGTYLCTNPTAASTDPRTVDSADPPTPCSAHPGVSERGWIDAGGGFSHVFARPSYQDALPAGSTPIGSMRGVPDIGLQASSRTGALIYVSLPPDGSGGLSCGSVPCSSGWYDIGGTSLSCPQWAALVAIADQKAGHGLGLINPTLYKIANGPNYANDFFDVTTGNNQTVSTIPGYPATTGWDPVTGLGTPNAANLIPDLAS